MKNRGTLIVSLFFIASLFGLIIPASAAIPSPDDTCGSHSGTALNVSQWSVAPMVATGWGHTVGLKSDGTVVAMGRNDEGQCQVSSWTEIVQVAAGMFHTVGLKSDGTVVAVGRNDEGQCDVGRWTDIIQISAGQIHTVGLKSDGTVVAKGSKVCWRGVGDWSHITQLAAGMYHTVGLKTDGTVVAVGNNGDGQCNVGEWTDIVKVAASKLGGITYGLRPDGTVVAVGNDAYGQCDVGSWTDIVQVTTYWFYVVGLKNDGTVITTTPTSVPVDVGNWNQIIVDVGNWNQIVLVAGGISDIAGLKSDGAVVSTQSDPQVDTWNLGIITEHTLAVSNTVGGAVTNPGEKSFNYTAGAMIHLVAKPDAGYHFANWTGDVDAIFSVNAATTIITMNNNHSITANFEKNPPILLIVVGIVVVVALAVFFFRERITTRTPYRQ
jgi:alpha-tubulin suppressor-like RCC1 family protein